MADHLVHAFTSTKPDSPDSTLVSSSEWNEGHYLTGGTDRQHVTFMNSAAPQRIRYVDGAVKYEATTNITAGTALPVVVGAFSVINATEIVYTASLRITLFVISAGTNCTANFRVGGGILQAYRFIAGAAQDYTFTYQGSVSVAGTSNFDIQITGPAATVTTGVVTLSMITIGR